jgi:hypothetical protein
MMTGGNHGDRDLKSVTVIDISIILLVILNGGENFYGGGNRDT